MKIALVIYGLPRGNKRVWRSILENLIETTGSDVFIHTWLNISTSYFHHGLQGKLGRILISYLEYFRSNCGEYLKNVIVDRQYAQGAERVTAPWGTVTFSNQQNSLISILQGMEKSLTSGQYDFILFTRSDVIFSKPLDVETIDSGSFIHSGHFVNNRFECEDLFFGFSPDHAPVMRAIQLKHSKNYYTDNNIYNAFINEFSSCGVPVSRCSLFYGNGISIHRRLVPRILNKIKRLFFGSR